VFHNWLASQGKTKATIKETVNYAKKYGIVLDTGDASPLLTLSPRNKHHAMTALANLAKFTGRYDQWVQLRHRYNMKWSKGDSIESFERFFNDELNFDTMLQRIKEMIRLTPSIANIIKFDCLTGLRPAEVVESVRLINDKEAFQKYYNPGRNALEHFRFPEVFFRQTKKAYISFIPPEVIEELVYQKAKIPTYDQIRLACWKIGIKCDMRYCRKIHASYLRQSGIESEIVDLLQGRVPRTVFARHYFTPSLDYRQKVLQALDKLRKDIER
jgi:integrase